MKLKFLTTAVALTFSLALAAEARASAIPIVDISNSPTSWSWAEDLTLGFTFSVGSSVTFNALGVFDVISATPNGTGVTNGVGLATSHQVAVWDSNGFVVASAVVDPTDPTVASQNTYGQWVYQTIAPVTLTAGTYTIGAFFGGNSDPVMVQQTALGSQGVSYIVGNYAYSDTFQKPTGTYGPNEQQYFGPSLFSVPDGGTTVLLLGCALVGLGLLGRNRQRG